MPPQIPTHNLSTGETGLYPWDTAAIQRQTQDSLDDASLRAAERLLEKSALLPDCLDVPDVRDELDRPLKASVAGHLVTAARRRREAVLVLQLHRTREGAWMLFANDARHGRRWIWGEGEVLTDDFLRSALEAFVRHAGKDVLFFPHGELTGHCRRLAGHGRRLVVSETAHGRARLALPAYADRLLESDLASRAAPLGKSRERLTHLDRLEAESIHIMREVAAGTDNPVMLYSVGKDSSVMLHLARKAFHPGRPPFPLLHVDTGWKFQAMYQFRDLMASACGMDLLVHINPEGREKNINPFDHGSQLHTDIMKTQGLKQALDKYGFDAAFGGARREEEKSRAKERVFSFRGAGHRWDPKNQRPELWNLYNTRKHKGETFRVFPLSNWTELDIWQYIYRERIPIVPLYFAAPRPVVEREGILTLADDDRLPLEEGQEIQIRNVRFRTLGCYPLTGAIESEAGDLASVMLELLQMRTSERQGRTIDHDTAASMEKKKMEGYF